MTDKKIPFFGARKFAQYLQKGIYNSAKEAACCERAELKIKNEQLARFSIKSTLELEKERDNLLQFNAKLQFEINTDKQKLKRK